MRDNNIYIIGAGLYGCLTALKIKKDNPNMRVNIVDSANHVLSVFDSVSLAGMSINNGFHGIELPRADKLYAFLIKELGVKLNRVRNIKKILISGHLVEYADGLSEYPDAIRKYFKEEKSQFRGCADVFNVATDEYLPVLEKVSHRYSDEVQNAIHLLAPWYFPSDFAIESDDEGDIFRNKVRAKLLNPEYAWPESGLFQELQMAFYNKLKEIGINLMLNHKVDISENGLCLKNPAGEARALNVDKDYIFYCAPPLSVLKAASPKIYSQLTNDPRSVFNVLLKARKSDDAVEFTEILCCDENIPSLSRVSKPSLASELDTVYIQLEIFEKNESVTDQHVEVVAYLESVMKKIGYYNFKILESRKTRTVFFPSSRANNDALECVRGWAKKFSNVHLLEAFGPINMAKTWDYSDKISGLINNSKGKV
jgi:hypothetical protein